LREERKLRVFENMVLRIFGPRKDEVTGEWGMGNGGMWHVARMGEEREVYRILLRFGGKETTGET